MADQVSVYRHGQSPLAATADPPGHGELAELVVSPSTPSTHDGSAVSRASLQIVAVPADASVRVRTTDPTLAVAIESSILTVAHGRDHSVLDRSVCLVVPARFRVEATSTAPAARLALVGFSEPLLSETEAQYEKLGLSRTRLSEWLAHLTVLPRTTWVHEIVHRYVFERYALREEDNPTTRFLEVEILKEVFFLFRDREEGADRATIGHCHSPPVARAIAWIEERLLEPCNLAGLSSHAGLSESSLLRAFRREVGSTPAAYWRGRKLDEALARLRGGGRTVTEVAIEVGYESPTAFGHAFRLRFGLPPSAVRPRRRVRPAP